MEEDVSSGDGTSKVSEVLTTKPPPPPPGQGGAPGGMPGMEGIDMDMMGGMGGMAGMGGMGGGAPEMPDRCASVPVCSHSGLICEFMLCWMLPGSVSFYTIAAEGVTSDSRTSWSGPAVESKEKTLKFKAYALKEKIELEPVCEFTRSCRSGTDRLSVQNRRRSLTQYPIPSDMRLPSLAGRNTGGSPRSYEGQGVRKGHPVRTGARRETSQKEGQEVEKEVKETQEGKVKTRRFAALLEHVPVSPH